jgi:hypothetical protein
MENITFYQIDNMVPTPDETRIAMEAAHKDLDSLTQKEFALVLHFYDLMEITHSESECKRLLLKYNIIPG